MNLVDTILATTIRGEVLSSGQARAKAPPSVLSRRVLVQILLAEGGERSQRVLRKRVPAEQEVSFYPVVHANHLMLQGSVVLSPITNRKFVHGSFSRKAGVLFLLLFA